MNAPTQALELIEPDDHPAAQHALAQQPSAAVVAHTAASPARLLQIAVEQGRDLAYVEKLMELQERWERNEARKQFVDAMTAFKAESLVILKRKRVSFETRDGDVTSYSHAELSDVCEVAIPALSRHGFSHSWRPTQANGQITVECILTHRAGHSETTQMSGGPDTSGKKNPLQQVASAITFMERYTLLMATGLSTKGQDDDGRDAYIEPVDEAVLRGFQDAAMNGEKALRKHYDDHVPTEEFWQKHSKALKAAAKAADSAVQGRRA